MVDVVVGLGEASPTYVLKFSAKFHDQFFLISCLQGSIVPDPVLWREAAQMEVESRRKQE